MFCLKEATTEVTREEQTVSYVSSVNDLLLIVQPIAGEFVGPLYQQPSLMAVDEQVGMFDKMVKVDLKNPFLNNYKPLHAF